MFGLSKDMRPKTVCDWVGAFCFLGCLLATAGLSCLGIANIWEKGLGLEAIDALFSMLKLLVLNCGFLLASWVVLYICPAIVLGIGMLMQPYFIYFSVLVLEFSFSTHPVEEVFLLPFTFSFAIQFAWLGFLMDSDKGAMLFIERAVSKGVTRPLLISYGLGVLFIFLAALGMFGLLANPISLFGKMSASVIACSTILVLAVAARLLRVLHASKVAHSRALLGSLQSDKVTAFVISQHLGSTFLCYAILCIPVMAAAIICISIEGWYSIVTISNSLITVLTMLFPIYDTICGTRMLIRKKSIWDDCLASLGVLLRVFACGAPIFLLQNTGRISSFGAVYYAHKFGLKLFGGAQVLNPYSILTCAAICLANNLLLANMVAESPAQIGIYLNAPHAANLKEITESEFADATSTLRECCN